MIDRLIPKYPGFLIVGLVIIGSGLFLLTTGRDALTTIWVNKFFDGETNQGLFQASQTAADVIGHTLTVWMFLGLSFLKLGIGFAIATIVRNLRATGERTIEAFAAAQVPGVEASRRSEPWYGRLFTRFLFAGILVVGFFSLMMLWWDVNLVFLRAAEFDGRTTGAAFNTYLMVDRVLNPIVGAGKFLGEGLLIFGIVTGLATIIWHLSFQARALPAFTQQALRPNDVNQRADSPLPYVPNALLKLGIAGFVLIALGTPLALIHSGFIGWALGRQFEGFTSETALRLEGIFGRTIDPLITLGLGMLFFTIAFLLLNSAPRSA